MDRGTRNASASARRVWFLLSGVLALAVLAGGGTYLAGSVFSASQASGQASASPQAGAAGCGAAGHVCLRREPGRYRRRRRAGGGDGSAAPGRGPRAPGTDHAVAVRRRLRPSSRPTVPVTGTAGAQPATSAAASAPATAQDATAAAQVLALINQARSSAGLPALTVTSGLEASSSAHNLKMAGGCGLSHQCPGEPAIGDRETAAGVHWTAAGENIGEGGPVDDTGTAIAQMAVGLTQSMLDEQPPNDGHRMNILSTSFTHIGIAVYRDGSGTVWLTQDFSN